MEIAGDPQDPRVTRTIAPAEHLASQRSRGGAPAAIGRYRIVRLIGEGGMGAVYEAEQEQPRRTVALKVIKSAWATPELVRRFQQESEALARLHHPGIAQVYEAGTADSGFGPQPYFAMEFIADGQSLTTYTEARRLTVRQRLELMTEVCDAVQHAHQRGIIHRDLKPGNILVDENGHPKVLDFGVARMTDSDARATRQTDVGQLVGTLAYMSPEQALADPLEVDIRSDVYALGVILYELLAGKLPYALSHKLHEAVMTIREQDPAPLTSVSRIYRGDIETIAAKALEKDKARRYASAADLAADIRRYLNNEPILARPATTSYQLKKFAQRHKSLVLGAAAVFLVLVAGVAASTWQALRARRAEVQARQEAASSQAVNQFLQDMLESADPFSSGRGDANGRDITVAQAVAQAIAKLDRGALKDQPLVEAAVRKTIGGTLMGLGDISGGEAQMRKALSLRRAHLPAGAAEIGESLEALAVLLQNKGDLKGAEPFAREALSLRRKLFGGESREVAQSEADLSMMVGRTPERLQLIQDAVRLSRKLDGETERTAIHLMYLATAYGAERRYAEAEPAAREALEIRRRILPEDHESIAASLQQLSNILVSQSRYTEAEPLARQSLAFARKVFGDEHLRVANAEIRLSEVLVSQGRLAEAEALRTESIGVTRRLIGDGPRIGVALQGLSLLLRDERKFDLAEQRLQEAMTIFRKLQPQQASNLAICISTLGMIRYDQRRFTEAEALQRDSLTRLRRSLGERDATTVIIADHLGDTLLEQGKLAEAEQLYRDFLTANRQEPQNSGSVRTLLTGLGHVMVAQHRAAEAEPIAREALNLAKKQPQELPWAQRLLGQVLTERGKFAEAEPLLLASYKPISGDTTVSIGTKQKFLKQLVDLYESWDKSAPNTGKATQAARWRTLLNPSTVK